MHGRETSSLRFPQVVARTVVDSNCGNASVVPLFLREEIPHKDRFTRSESLAGMVYASHLYVLLHNIPSLRRYQASESNSTRLGLFHGSIDI